jgi:CRISPR-associated endonuclease/helicase Cas3
MSALKASDFRAFFSELNGHAPFPWQERLAGEVLAGGWPAAISLPTASGKTACLDVAVFALAASSVRRQPRRIFFVVDRRLVVDEAHIRAVRISRRLAEATGGVLGAVAARLRALAGDEDAPPLATAVLRGGIYRDDRWARSPLQPTIVLSTVDQVGSRLLFRGYGVSPNAWPIHAGLIATDSLIIVDEAHTSAPFVQTLGWVQRYSGERWTERTLPTGLHVVSMSATPVAGGSAAPPFTLDKADRLHKVLRKRLQAHKKASLVVAPDKEPGFVSTVAKQAAEVASGARAVGVVVNRVATARAVHAELEARAAATGKVRLDADVILLTGRVRSMERDALVSSYRERLFSDPGREPGAVGRPLIVVATQCIEVGADLDFDALVTECAPIDALRQRFGRLDRLGQRGESRAVILVRKNQAPEDGSVVDDPVYGEALSRTWYWLRETVGEGEAATFDFGIDHFDTDGLPSELLTPPKAAPVMLPSHADCWAQTSPTPHADPDPAVFLHGPVETRADVQLVWRADLDPEAPDTWADAVAVCPPSSPEAMAVPLHELRAWLAGSAAPEASDVESGDEEEADSAGAPRAARQILRWAGPDDERTGVVVATDPIRPGETFVVPAALGGCDRFGWNPDSDAPVADLGDEAQALRRNAVLRLVPSTLPPWTWLSAEAAAALVPLAAAGPDQEVEQDDVLEALARLAGEEGAPEWLRALAAHLRCKGLKVVAHPGGRGLVLSTNRRLPVSSSAGATGEFADDSTSSAAAKTVPLIGHLEQVARLAARYARLLGLPGDVVADVERAGHAHDWGKADPRFQLWLAGGDPAALAAAGGLIAKSPRLPRSPSALRKARERSGYPKGGRHELLSVRLAEAERQLLGAAADRDLVLYLVSSHHGRCRPLAPLVFDPSPLEVPLPLPGGRATASSETGLESLDSDVLERFWRLVRRYGWWGLAYLEAVLRLADQRASEMAREES